MISYFMKNSEENFDVIVLADNSKEFGLNPSPQMFSKPNITYLK